MSWSRALLVPTLLLFAAGVLAACGFQPVYRGAGGVAKGAVAAELSQVEVGIIKDRTGQILRNQLLTLLSPKGRPAKPRYRLAVVLSESRQELALKKSEIATRANLTLSATFHLFDTAGKNHVVGGTSRIVVSYNVLTAEFATLAAEEDARRRAAHELALDIADRLAAHFREQGAT